MVNLEIKLTIRLFTSSAHGSKPMQIAGFIPSGDTDADRRHESALPGCRKRGRCRDFDALVRVIYWGQLILPFDMKILVLVLTLLLAACSAVTDKLAALKPTAPQPAAPAYKGAAWTPITESATRTFYYEPYGLSLESPGVFVLRIASVQKEAQQGTTVRKPDIVTWKINCIDSTINSSELDKWIPTVKGSISEFIKNEICGSVYPANRLPYHYVGLADRVRYYIQGNEVLVHGGADDARALRILSSSTDDKGKQRVLLLRYEVNCRPRTNLVYNTTDDKVMLAWKTVEPGANSIDAFLFDRACNGTNTYMARVKAFTEPDSLAGSKVQFRAPIKEAPAKADPPAKADIPAKADTPAKAGSPAKIGDVPGTSDAAGRTETPITGPSDLKSPLRSGSGAVWKPSQFGTTPSLQYGNTSPAPGYGNTSTTPGYGNTGTTPGTSPSLQYGNTNSAPGAPPPAAPVTPSIPTQKFQF